MAIASGYFIANVYTIMGGDPHTIAETGSHTAHISRTTHCATFSSSVLQCTIYCKHLV